MSHGDAFALPLVLACPRQRVEPGEGVERHATIVDLERRVANGVEVVVALHGRDAEALEQLDDSIGMGTALDHVAEADDPIDAGGFEDAQGAMEVVELGSDSMACETNHGRASRLACWIKRARDDSSDFDQRCIGRLVGVRLANEGYLDLTMPTPKKTTNTSSGMM